MPEQTGGSGMRRGMLTLEQLRVAVGEGEVDTVVLAFTDRDAQLLQGQQAATMRALASRYHLANRHQTESSRSIAASSSAVPWTFGPVNQFRADASQ